MDHNKIKSLKGLATLKNVHTLWFNSNEIEDSEEVLEELEKISSLTSLSILKNPGCPDPFSITEGDDYQRFRFYLIWRLKNLKTLDGRKITLQERQESEKRGKFSKVIKVKEKEYTKEELENKEEDINFNLKEGKHSSYFGYSKQHYTGNNSEGNRFIKNDHL
jgi:leucine-rich melanocyte differentiation-associated protein